MPYCPSKVPKPWESRASSKVPGSPPAVPSPSRSWPVASPVFGGAMKLKGQVSSR